MTPEDTSARSMVRPLALGWLCLLLVTGAIPVGTAAGLSGDAPSASSPTSLGQHNQEPGPVTSLETQESGCGTGEVLVQGTAKYYYEADTFNPGYNKDYHPIRQAPVNISAYDPAGNTTLVTVRTNESGYFSACIKRTGPNGNTRTVFARIWARTPAATVYDEVNTFLSNGSIYTGYSETVGLANAGTQVTLGSDTSDFDLQPEVVPESNNTAFHLVNTTLFARQFVRAKTSDNWTRRHIRLIYPKNGTSYNPNPPIDDDEALWFENQPFTESRQAVFHEYGHALMAAAFGYNNRRSPVGGRNFTLPDNCHSYGTESGKAYAWREGWAEYFSALARSSWNDGEVFYNQTPSQVVCRPADDDGTMDGWRVEGSIAGALWDVTDDPLNDDDSLDASFDLVLDGMRSRYPQDIWELYDYLEGNVSNTEELQRVFTRQGIDVAPPNLTVDGGTSQSTTGSTLILSGEVADAHSNVTRLSIRQNGGAWQPVAVGNVARWSRVVQLTSLPTTLTLRATDYYGNNATTTVQVTNGSSGGPTGPFANLTRRINKQAINAGGTAEVTVTAEMQPSGGPFSLSESFSGQVADATIQSVTVDGQSASPVVAQADANGAVVTLSSTAPNATVNVTYRIQATGTAGQITVTGEATSGGTASLGKDTISVAPCVLKSIPLQYDTDSSCSIEIGELGRAAADYARGNITIGELGTVAAAYASS